MLSLMKLEVIAPATYPAAAGVDPVDNPYVDALRRHKTERCLCVSCARAEVPLATFCLSGSGPLFKNSYSSGGGGSFRVDNWNEQGSTRVQFVL